MAKASSQEAEVEVRIRELQDGHLDPDAWDRLLGYLDGLESTQVAPIIPMLLGMITGLAVAVGLLLASL